MNNAAAVVSIVRGGFLPSPCHIALGRFAFAQPAFMLQPGRPSAKIVHAFRSLSSDVQQCQFLSVSSRRSFSASPLARLLKPYEFDGKPERGLSFHGSDLKAGELRRIFGKNRPDDIAANRLLRILHGRRVDGTLDLPLPEDVEETTSAYPTAVNSGLAFLRKAYPIDEDTAIEDRIDREEDVHVKDNPSQLLQRGQDLGFYKGPQSGYYQALSSDTPGDVHGRSELDALRAENEAAAAREEEEIQNRFEAEQAKHLQDKKVRALAQRPEQGLQASEKEFRPPNEFEKWVLKAQSRATSKLTLESPEIAEASLASRLLPSLALVAALCAACFYYAQTWSRPKQSERLFPNLSLSTATVSVIMGINAAVFLAWRFPPLWGMLNRYFVIVPAYPYALSMLGSIFSHQSFTHLAFNMAAIYMFAPQLHEEVGRGNFLAIYLASGLIGGYVSFARSAVQRLFTTSSLGASGSCFGVLSAFLWLRSDKQFTFFFVPEAYQKYLTFTGASLIGPLILLETLGVLRIRRAGLDYLNHLVGLGVGLGAAEYLKRRRASDALLQRSTANSKLSQFFGKGKP